jgi:SAM-dependent methyltransferase
MPHDEKAFLDAVQATYAHGSPQDRAIRGLIVRTFRPWLQPGMRVLQLGYSEGIDTGLVQDMVAQLDVVEGAAGFAGAARDAARDGAQVFECLFEDFTLPPGAQPYDAVIASYVLEHVQQVDEVLAMVRRVLVPGGKLLVAVPNARALSRQLARHMGLIDDLTTLTENDHRHGHRRVYDRVSLNRDLERAGFLPIAQGGVMLKPLADFQMDHLFETGILGDAQVDGLYRLGLEYPDLCGTLYAVCEVAR